MVKALMIIDSILCGWSILQEYSILQLAQTEWVQERMKQERKEDQKY